MALLGGEDQVWQWSVSWGTFSRETTADMSVGLQVGRCVSDCYRLSSELSGKTKLTYSSRLRGHVKYLIDILVLSNKNKSEGFFRSKFIIFGIKFDLWKIWFWKELNLMTDSLHDCRLESCLPLLIRWKAWKVLIQGDKTLPCHTDGRRSGKPWQSDCEGVQISFQLPKKVSSPYSFIDYQFIQLC